MLQYKNPHYVNQHYARHYKSRFIQSRIVLIHIVWILYTIVVSHIVWFFFVQQGNSLTQCGFDYHTPHIDSQRGGKSWLLSTSSCALHIYISSYLNQKLKFHENPKMIDYSSFTLPTMTGSPRPAHLALMLIWIFCLCKAKFRLKHTHRPYKNTKTQRLKMTAYKHIFS